MAAYIALIRKAKGTCYGVEFPDFPGCISAGDTLEEAVQEGAAALSLHLRGMRDDGEPIPEPTPIEKILALKEARGAIPAVIVVPKKAPRPRRVNVMLDPGLLGRIDEAAAAEGLTRSGWIAELARAALRGRRSAA